MATWRFMAIRNSVNKRKSLNLKMVGGFFMQFFHITNIKTWLTNSKPMNGKNKFGFHPTDLYNI